MSWIERTEQNFRNLDLRNLKVDEAYLNVSNQQAMPYFLYLLSVECVKCPFRFLEVIENGTDTLVTVNTARKFQLSLYRKNYGNFVDGRGDDELFWTATPSVGEFGVYDLIIPKNGSAVFETAKEPVNTTYPIFIIALIMFALYFTFKCAKNNLCYDYLMNLKAKTAKAKNIITMESTDNKKRLKCLDIFRGFSIVIMILGNCGGGRYWWVEHATWNGLHAADLVFPWFLFIMGFCIPLSVKSMLKRSVDVKGMDMIARISKRAFILFFLGVCFNTIGGSSLKDIRIFGVLQKFGIAYLIVSLIYISLPSTSYDSIPVKSIKRHFLDITSIYKQWLVILFLIIIHMLIIFGISAPNCDLGYFGPGGIHDFGAHANCTGGIAGYIDRLLLGDSHLYQKANVMAVYAASLPFDPEGPFGSFLACVQVFLGVQCCMTILNYQKPAERLVRWIFWGLILLAVTAVLTSCSIDDGLIPINKNLWSLTFVTVTSALAFLLISLIYFLVDVKNIGDDCWTLFLYPGMNPIVIYIGHFVFHHMWPFRWNYEGMNTHFEFMIENFYNVVIWVLISHGMYYCNIFYKI